MALFKWIIVSKFGGQGIPRAVERMCVRIEILFQNENSPGSSAGGFAFNISRLIVRRFRA